MKTDTYLAIRDNRVTKANELIQKSRFNLSLQQQKIVLYLISQITPYDEDFKLYDFSIPEFCRVCGSDYNNGKNYKDLKTALKEIRDKSIWVTLPDGRETTLAWIEKPYIEPKNGVVQVRLDKDMKPYLLQLKDNFTSYELIYTLHFKSKYTIRLYELIKSIHFHELETYTRSYAVDELRRLLDAETYAMYKDFKKRVLDTAIQEINEYSDKELSYSEIKAGKKVVSIEFTVRTKEPVERLKVRDKIDKEMGTNGQISLWEMVQAADQKQQEQ